MKGIRFRPTGILAQLLGTVSVATAQEKHPSRPIMFIVPWGSGSGAD